MKSLEGEIDKKKLITDEKRKEIIEKYKTMICPEEIGKIVHAYKDDVQTVIDEIKKPKNTKTIKGSKKYDTTGKDERKAFLLPFKKAVLELNNKDQLVQK